MNKRISAFISLLALSGTTTAQQVYYVDDELTITMRSGESTQHQIIRTLTSGTKLNVIETHKDTGYSLARTDSGTEGWVLTRYLSAQPVAKQQLTVVNNTIKQLNQQVDELRTELKQNSEGRKTAETSNSQLVTENRQMSQELKEIKETASNAIAINQDNQTLREKLIHMETEVQTLQQQNAVLSDRRTRDWVITGAGITILGILIGLIIPRLRLQRKSKWNEL